MIDEDFAAPCEPCKYTVLLLDSHPMYLSLLQNVRHYLYQSSNNRCKVGWTQVNKIQLSRPNSKINSGSLDRHDDLLIHDNHHITRHCHALGRGGGAVHTNHTTLPGTR